MAIYRVHSKNFGELGSFRAKAAEAFRAGPITALGSGIYGGKGHGTIKLYRSQKVIRGYQVPRSWLVPGEFWGIPEIQYGHQHSLRKNVLGRFNLLLDSLRSARPALGPLIIRSSSPVEDQIADPAAGLFLSECHPDGLSFMSEKLKFFRRLLAVLNSGYSEQAVEHYKKYGYTAIPPMPLVIQEVVGIPFGDVRNSCFGPTRSGIVNTSAANIIRVASLVGLGTAAVGAAGAGRLHCFTSDENGTISEFGSPRGDIDALFSSTKALRMANLPVGAEVLCENFHLDLHEIRRLIESLQMQIQLATIARQFEAEMGTAVDIEWATDDIGDKNRPPLPYLVQLRPLPKRDLVEKPLVDDDQLYCATNAVFGYGTNQFEHIIHIGSPDFDFQTKLYRILGKLARRFPQSAIIVSSTIDRVDAKEMVIKRLLPHSDAVIMLDAISRHTSGTGLQHLALNVIAQGKLVLTVGMDHAHTVRGIEKTCIYTQTIDRAKIEVFKCTPSLVVAGDDAAGWGMAYWSEPIE